ncbi:ester cyclase [Paraburkholderia xenovorans]
MKLKVFEPHGQSRVRAKRTILSDDRRRAVGQTDSVTSFEHSALGGLFSNTDRKSFKRQTDYQTRLYAGECGSSTSTLSGTHHVQNLKGTGQTVDFQAFDLYRVKDGRIVDNWHLEDNLTLLKTARRDQAVMV